MKYLLALSLALFLLSSCTVQMIQVFNTSTSNTKLIDSNWVFEDDTVKITYDFWANNGAMAFSVYNKLDKPIYIDWKNSSFIYNGIKLDYWIEEQKTSQASSSFYYKGLLVQESSSNEIKPEKITFIPPKSSYARLPKFYLEAKFFAINHKLENVITVPNSLNPNKIDSIYQENFNYSNSPIKFRNYLAFSFSEISQDFFFVDNEFYLSSVKDMQYSTYQGKPIGDIGQGYIYGKSPYKHPTSFYIKHKNNYLP